MPAPDPRQPPASASSAARPSEPAAPQPPVTHAGRQYQLFVAHGVTWDEARAHCRRLGSDLVSLEAEAERSFLVGYVAQSAAADLLAGPVWLGGAECSKAPLRFCWLSGAEVSFPFEHQFWIRNGMGAEPRINLVMLRDGKLCANGIFLRESPVGGFVCESVASAR
jgi:hypothetical protein